MAVKNKMDLSIAVALGSSIQVQGYTGAACIPVCCGGDDGLGVNRAYAADRVFSERLVHSNWGTLVACLAPRLSPCLVQSPSLRADLPHPLRTSPSHLADCAVPDPGGGAGRVGHGPRLHPRL